MLAPLPAHCALQKFPQALHHADRAEEQLWLWIRTRWLKEVACLADLPNSHIATHHSQPPCQIIHVALTQRRGAAVAVEQNLVAQRGGLDPVPAAHRLCAQHPAVLPRDCADGGPGLPQPARYLGLLQASRQGHIASSYLVSFTVDSFRMCCIPACVARPACHLDSQLSHS